MDYATARSNMVKSQICTNHVTDPAVVAAMAALPRELFVPKELCGIAYVDEDIRVAPGRYLLEPMVLARLLQLATIKETDMVLVIGASTGYSAAVAGRIANTVVALENDEALLALAGKTLHGLGFHNVALVQGDLAAGYAKQAPYDVIIIDGAVEVLPQTLIDQLADGGRLAAVIGNTAPGNTVGGKGTLWVRAGTAVSRRAAFDANTPVLPEFKAKPGFVF